MGSELSKTPSKSLSKTHSRVNSFFRNISKRETSSSKGSRSCSPTTTTTTITTNTTNTTLSSRPATRSTHYSDDSESEIPKTSLPRTEYVWPTSDEEEARLLKIHELRKAMFKGLAMSVRKPLEKGTRVLYMGRDQFWALDMAKTHPNAEVHCIDYAKVRGKIISEAIKPPNYFVHDIEPGVSLPFPENYFDLTVSRFLMFVLTETDWTRHLKDIIRVTKCGGYIETLETNAHVYNGGPVTERAMISVTYSTRANGHSPTCHRVIHNFFDEYPLIDPTGRKTIIRNIPIGPWMEDPEEKEYGRIFLESFKQEVESLIPYFSKMLGVPSEELRSDVATMMEEFKHGNCYRAMHYEVAKKAHN